MASTLSPAADDTPDDQQGRDPQTEDMVGLVEGAWQLSEQLIGCLLVMVVDAMSGMVTQGRLPRRDEMNAYYRTLPLCDPGKLQPNRQTGEANA
ncbi:hypothetical protein [Streptomyces albospinus]|uniref:hypothetical protein n=1 Tax=Streptomyces albospinus TaxID=285515 RepID=UPI001671829B